MRGLWERRPGLLLALRLQPSLELQSLDGRHPGEPRNNQQAAGRSLNCALVSFCITITGKEAPTITLAMSLLDYSYAVCYHCSNVNSCNRFSKLDGYKGELTFFLAIHSNFAAAAYSISRFAFKYGFYVQYDRYSFILTFSFSFRRKSIRTVEAKHLCQEIFIYCSTSEGHVVNCQKDDDDDKRRSDVRRSAAATRQLIEVT